MDTAAGIEPWRKWQPSDTSARCPFERVPPPAHTLRRHLGTVSCQRAAVLSARPAHPGSCLFFSGGWHGQAAQSHLDRFRRRATGSVCVGQGIFESS